MHNQTTGEIQGIPDWLYRKLRNEGHPEGPSNGEFSNVVSVPDKVFREYRKESQYGSVSKKARAKTRSKAKAKR